MVMQRPDNMSLQTRNAVRAIIALRYSSLLPVNAAESLHNVLQLVGGVEGLQAVCPDHVLDFCLQCCLYVCRGSLGECRRLLGRSRRLPHLLRLTRLKALLTIVPRLRLTKHIALLSTLSSVPSLLEGLLLPTRPVALHKRLSRSLLRRLTRERRLA